LVRAGGTDPGLRAHRAGVPARIPTGRPIASDRTTPYSARRLAAGALRARHRGVGPTAGGDRAGAGPLRRDRCAARIGNPRHATGSPPGLAPAQAARTTAIPTCGGPTQAC